MYLKDQAKYNYFEGSQGRSVVYHNGRLYAICEAFSKYQSSNFYTSHLLFIKFSLNGDTLLTRIINKDSINYVTALPKLSVNVNTNKLEFGFRYRRDFNFISKMWFDQIEIDTNGFITKTDKIQINVDSTRYSTFVSYYQLGRKKYAVVIRNESSNDSTQSYVLKIENGTAKDTLLTYNNDTIKCSFIRKMIELNSNRFMVVETRKQVGQNRPFKGKTYCHLYDSTFMLLKTIEFPDYHPLTEFALDGDSVVILGMESFTVQFPNNYIFYSLKKIGPDGEVLLDWQSRKYTKDTARDDHSVLMLG